MACGCQELQSLHGSLPLMFEEGRLHDLEPLLAVMLQTLVRHESLLGQSSSAATDAAQHSERSKVAEHVAAQQAAAEQAAVEKAHEDLRDQEKQAREKAQAEAEKQAREKAQAEAVSAEQVKADRAAADTAAKEEKAAKIAADREERVKKAAERASERPVIAGPAGKFEVIGERLVVRTKPSTQSASLGMQLKGATLMGTPHHVGELQWLKLEEQQCQLINLSGSPSEAWMLIDGSPMKGLNLGVLLQRNKEPVKLSKEAKAKLMANVRPAVPDMDREGLPLWLVVGGVGKGGIVVRQLEELGSKPLGKLETGTTCEEMEIVGNRLHYRRIRGDGPDFGWVNIKFNDKCLVERVESDSD